MKVGQHRAAPLPGVATLGLVKEQSKKKLGNPDVSVARTFVRRLKSDSVVSESTVKASILSLNGAAKVLMNHADKGRVSESRAGPLASQMKKLGEAVEAALGHRGALRQDDPALERFDSACAAFSSAWHQAEPLFRNERLHHIGDLGNDVASTIAQAVQLPEVWPNRNEQQVGELVTDLKAGARRLGDRTHFAYGLHHLGNPEEISIFAEHFYSSYPNIAENAISMAVQTGKVVAGSEPAWQDAMTCIRTAQTRANTKTEEVPTPRKVDLADELQAIIAAPHDYNATISAVVDAGEKVLRHLSRKLGTYRTGSLREWPPASPMGRASLGVFGQLKQLKGPFAVMDGKKICYPQYNLQDRFREHIASLLESLGPEAQRRLDLEGKSLSAEERVMLEAVVRETEKAGGEAGAAIGSFPQQRVKFATPGSMSDLMGTIDQAIEQNDDDVTTMQDATAAVMKFVGKQLGASGDQMDQAAENFLRDARSIPGSIHVIDGLEIIREPWNNELGTKFERAMDLFREEGAVQARENMRKHDPQKVHPNVWARWEELGGYSVHADRQKKEQFIEGVGRTVASAEVVAAALTTESDTAIGAALAEAAAKKVSSIEDSVDELVKTELKGPLSRSEMRDLSASVDELCTIQSKVSAYLIAQRDAQLEKQKPKDAKIIEEVAFDFINQATEELAQLANAAQEPVAILINGAWMVARPGNTPDQIHKRWRAQQQKNYAVPNGPEKPLAAIGGALAERLEIEEIARLSEREPRPLEEVIQVLEERGRYGDYIMAGLKGLRHPGEIAAFAQHCYDVAKMGGSKDLPDQQQMIKNMLLWVNEMEASAPGTKSVWNDAIDSIRA